jgi:type I restriction enzyme S subunit
VLVSITADIGIVSWVGEGVPSPAYINQHVSLIRFLRPGVNSRYVAYFLAAEASQRAFRAQTDQGAKAGMNLEEVRRVRLVLPSEAEQTAIATAFRMSIPCSPSSTN